MAVSLTKAIQLLLLARHLSRYFLNSDDIVQKSSTLILPSCLNFTENRLDMIYSRRRTGLWRMLATIAGNQAVTMRTKTRRSENNYRGNCKKSRLGSVSRKRKTECDDDGKYQVVRIGRIGRIGEVILERIRCHRYNRIDLWVVTWASHARVAWH